MDTQTDEVSTLPCGDPAFGVRPVHRSSGLPVDSGCCHMDSLRNWTRHSGVAGRSIKCCSFDLFKNSDCLNIGEPE